MRVAVVGHVEWIELARVAHVPAPGQIVHALEVWEEPAGGGAVAAVQLARLAGECLFLTALGDDDLGHTAKRGLEALGVRVEAAWRSEPQRRAFVHVDADAERTITVLGARMGPRADDPLPWSELDGLDAGLTYGLADGRSPQEALALGARCGAGCMTGRGPYEGQLRTAD